MNILINILNKLKLLSSFNLRVNKNIAGSAFKIPVNAGLGFNNINGTEPWMLSVIEHLLKLKKGCFIDIGANLGQSMLKLKAVSRECSYIGFEPNPYCISYLEELIKVNKLKNTIVIPAGISNKTDLLTLNFYDDTLTDSSASLNPALRPQHKIYFKKIVFVVDYNLVKGILPEEVCIVKIDVEGYEEQVIKGIEELIISKRPFILMEILPVYNETFKDRLQSQLYLEGFFRLQDYKILRIYKTTNGDLKELASIDAIGIHSNIDWCEYLIVPGEKFDAIQLMQSTGLVKPR